MAEVIFAISKRPERDQILIQAWDPDQDFSLPLERISSRKIWLPISEWGNFTLGQEVGSLKSDPMKVV